MELLTDKDLNSAVTLSHIDLYILPNPCTVWIFLSQHLQPYRKWFETVICQSETTVSRMC